MVFEVTGRRAIRAAPRNYIARKFEKVNKTTYKFKHATMFITSSVQHVAQFHFKLTAQVSNETELIPVTSVTMLQSTLMTFASVVLTLNGSKQASVLVCTLAAP